MDHGGELRRRENTQLLPGSLWILLSIFHLRLPLGGVRGLGLISLSLSSLSLPVKFKFAAADQASLLHGEAFEDGVLACR